MPKVLNTGSTGNTIANLYRAQPPQVLVHRFKLNRPFSGGEGDISRHVCSAKLQSNNPPSPPVWNVLFVSAVCFHTSTRVTQARSEGRSCVEKVRDVCRCVSFGCERFRHAGKKLQGPEAEFILSCGMRFAASLTPVSKHFLRQELIPSNYLRQATCITLGIMLNFDAAHDFCRKNAAASL